MSFLHVNEQGIVGDDIKMEILIYDVQSNDEFLISQINGRVKSKNLISDPTDNEPIWRFSVEFLDLDATQRQTLKTCLGLALNSCLDS